MRLFNIIAIGMLLAGFYSPAHAQLDPDCGVLYSQDFDSYTSGRVDSGGDVLPIEADSDNWYSLAGGPSSAAASAFFLEQTGKLAVDGTPKAAGDVFLWVSDSPGTNMDFLFVTKPVVTLPGADYTVTFEAAAGNNNPLPSFQVYVSTDGGATWIPISIAVVPIPNGRFQEFSFTFTATTSSLIFRVADNTSGGLGNDGGIDNVQFFKECSDFSDAPGSYGVPSHITTVLNGTTVLLGANKDADLGPAPSVNADSDDTNDITNDEDGVTFSAPGFGQTILADVVVTNSTVGSVTACCWLDILAGGSVDGVFDASDGQCQSTSLASTTLTFQWSGLPTDQAYDTYARCRITSDSMTTSEATGAKSDGEVEDYAISFDFTPTAVTIGDVSLESLSVTDYLNSAALDQLQALLASYGLNTDGMDSAALIAALIEFLDPDGGGQVALFRWDTLEERGTIGFYVERQNQGQNDGQDWSRVNNDLLPGLITAPMGAEYQLLDPGAQPGTTYQYQLIELEADGNTRSYGPYSLQMP